MNKPTKIRGKIELRGGEAGLPSEIQIIKPGSFDTTKYGHFDITEDDLNQAVENFGKDIRAHSSTDGLPINKDHEQKDAIGWIKKLENRGHGQGLWATALEWTEKGAQMIKDGTFKFLSPEFDFLHTVTETGEEIPNVLLGVAATNYPMFRTLKAIKANEKSDQKSENIIYLEDNMKIKAKENAGENQSLEDEINEIADAYGDALNNPFKTQFYGYKIVGTFEDEGTETGHLIIVADPDCDSYSWGDFSHVKFYQVDFKEDEEKEVYTFEDPILMKQEFVPDQSVKNAEQYDSMTSNELKAKEKMAKDDKEDKKDAESGTKEEETEMAEKKVAETKDKKKEIKKEEKMEASENISISASELEDLKLRAAEGDAALLKVRKMEASEKVKAWEFNEKDGGKFPTTLHDEMTEFVLGLNSKQLVAFEKIVDGMPNAKMLFNEESKDDKEVLGGDEANDLLGKAEEIMAKEENKGISFADAIKIAGRENPSLADKVGEIKIRADK